MSTQLLSRYLKEKVPFPYCKGCGHTLIDRGLVRALADLNLDPMKVVVVSDIGCVGLVDKLLKTHTVHTLHGRSTAVAAGIQMADELVYEDGTRIVVMIGDGGATIGLLHLVEAARMNLDLTVILHNNFLYGMTGGQHSGLTPPDFRTSTTPMGNPVRPINIVEILRASGATFLARTYAQDRTLPEILARAIAHRGFALVEVLELCTAYAVRYNQITGAALRQIAEALGMEMGILLEKQEPTFAERYREKTMGKAAQPREIPVLFRSPLNRRFSIFLAGTAGEGVQSSANLLAIAANMAGLFTTQKNDNPVTVGTGYSTSELVLDRKPIEFTGVTRADLMVVTSPDGLARVRPRLKQSPPHLLVLDEELDLRPEGLEILRYPLRKSGPGRGVNLVAIGLAAALSQAVPLEALTEAIRRFHREPDQALPLVEKGYQMA